MGSRLLVPVSDAMLAQFADNFRKAAAAVVTAQAEAATAAAATSAAAAAAAPAPAPAPAVQELNALALMWTVFKGWLAGLFGKKG